MKKTALALASFILLVSSASALNAQIDQNPPQDIVLDAGNSYEVTKNYSSSASTGNIKSREWNLLDTSQSASGLESQFTFSRSNGVSASNVIRLTVSNGTSTSVDEVTQVVHDVPNASITADKTTIITGETVSVTSTVTNSFTDGTLTYNWKWDGSGTISESNSTLQKTFSSTGTYKIKLEVKEAQGYSSTSSPVIIQVNSKNNNQNNNNNGGSGGGGGGGGGFPALSNETASNETDSNQSAGLGSKKVIKKTKIIRETKVVFVETERSSATFNITKGKGVKSLEINVNPESESASVKRIRITSDSSGQVSVSVRNLGARKPEQVPEPASENVYTYQEISTSLNDTEIDAAEIDFRVNRSWLEQRNATPEEVVMKRYSSKPSEDQNRRMERYQEWENLPTRHINSTENFHNFEASSSGFSYYAVALEDQQGKGNQTTEEPAQQEERSLPVIPLAIALLVLLLAAAAFLYRERIVGMMGGDIRKKRLKRKLDSIRRGIEDGKLDEEDKDQVLESVERARDLIQQDELEEAETIIERIEGKLE
ncbi:MAG: PGF-pre-PGF domain-containing protein [Candidatus Nanosalina sp.]